MADDAPLTADQIVTAARDRAIAAARRVVEIADSGGRVEDALTRTWHAIAEHGAVARQAASDPEWLEREYAESVGPCPFE